MEYRKTVGILAEEAEDIVSLLQYRPQSEENYKEHCIPADSSFSIVTIEFENGYSADIQLHGGEYENDSATAWVDGCLKNADGEAIDVSDASDTVIDSFEIKDGDDIYCVSFVPHELEKGNFEKADELEVPVPTLNISDAGLELINRLSLNNGFDNRDCDREMEM